MADTLNPNEPETPPPANDPAPPADPPADPPAPEPTLLAGKYKTAEDLEKGYLELQKKLGGQPDPKPDGESQETPEGGETAEAEPQAAETPPPPATIDEVLTRAGLAQDDLATRFTEHGSLSDEQYEALAKQGYPKAVVDGFYAGQQAQIQLLQRRAYDEAGGEKQFNHLMDWAEKSFDDATIDQMENKLRDPSTTVAAVKEIKQAYESAVRSAGSRPLLGGGAPPPSQGGFTDHHEYMAYVRQITKNNRRPTPSELERIRQTPVAVTQGRRIS